MGRGAYIRGAYIRRFTVLVISSNDYPHKHIIQISHRVRFRVQVRKCISALQLYRK